MKTKQLMLAIGSLIFLLNCQHPIDEKERFLIQEVVRQVEQNHLNPRTVDDELSEELFVAFLDKLDPAKEFLTQQDIEALKTYKTGLDDELKAGTLLFFNQSLKLLDQGIQKAIAYSQKQLADNIRLDQDDFVELVSTKASYAVSDEALQLRWKKKVKYQLLTELFEQAELQSFKHQKAIDSKYLDRVQQFFDHQFQEVKSLDRASRLVEYLNCYMRLNDFQTAYMDQQGKAAWDAAFNRSFVGVGLNLKMVNGYPLVQELIIGGPAWKSGALQPGDKILTIEGVDQKAVDVLGMRMKGVIALLKGEKGTKVRVEISRGGKKEEVVLQRDQIKTDLVMSLLLKHDQLSEKIGYLRVPRFYAGTEGAAAHVLAELEKQKQNGVEGIIVDLRNNKGGSAREAIDITGYFIEQGPVMQMKRKGEELQIYEDDDSSVQFDGELIVLINSRSGSASELFSGSIQDYGRGVIVGSKQTFGKGTSQGFYPIEEKRTDSLLEYGTIKMTHGVFYTASGRSPQYDGIQSDIVLPDDFMFVLSGERVSPTAMKATVGELTKPRQTVNTNPNLASVKKRSAERVEKNDFFQLATERAKRLKEEQNEKRWSLHGEAFQQEKTIRQSRQDRLMEARSKPLAYQALVLPQDIESGDTILMAKYDQWIPTIGSDPYIEECLWIMKDLLTS